MRYHWPLILVIAHRFARSLRANGFARFTTIVSVMSVALGCVALIIAISVLTGYEEKIEETAMRFTSHIEAKPMFGDVVTNAASTTQLLQKIDGIASVDIVLNREALARTRSGVDGIILSGVTQYRSAAFINPMIIRGGSVSPNGVVVGELLAKTLGVDVGDTMVVYAANADATQPILFSARVGGILRSGMASFDNSVVVMPIEAVGTHLRLPQDVASSLLITCADVANTRRFTCERRVGSTCFRADLPRYISSDHSVDRFTEEAHPSCLGAHQHCWRVHRDFYTTHCSSRENQVSCYPYDDRHDAMADYADLSPSLNFNWSCRRCTRFCNCFCFCLDARHLSPHPIRRGYLLRLRTPCEFFASPLHHRTRYFDRSMRSCCNRAYGISLESESGTGNGFLRDALRDSPREQVTSNQLFLRKTALRNSVTQ